MARIEGPKEEVTAGSSLTEELGGGSWLRESSDARKLSDSHPSPNTPHERTKGVSFSLINLPSVPLEPLCSLPDTPHLQTQAWVAV